MRTGLNRIHYVWLVTSALTVLSWLLAALRHGHVSASTAEAVAVLAIAAVKVRYIARDFMEVRSAPRWLRRCTEGWLVGLIATVLGMYLY